MKKVSKYFCIPNKICDDTEISKYFDSLYHLTFSYIITNYIEKEQLTTSIHIQSKMYKGIFLLRILLPNYVHLI